MEDKQDMNEDQQKLNELCARAQLKLEEALHDSKVGNHGSMSLQVFVATIVAAAVVAARIDSINRTHDQRGVKK